MANAATGDIREVLEEKGETFLESGNGRVNWKVLAGSNEAIWFSQKDNWGQLYLHDLKTGKQKSQLTSGEGNVTQLLRIDEATRTIRLRQKNVYNFVTALLFLAILPFWTNYLIRTYSWIVLLNPAGLVNGAMQAMGLPALPLLYNEFAVVLGLVYNYTPFVILAIYAALQRLDLSYAEASRDLGATAAQTFWRITLPLTAPGVAAGAVFVFVLSIGNFITPDLLGGGKLQMAGNLIYDQFLTARDWPFGATLSAILIAIMILLLFTQSIFSRRALGERS